MRIAFVVSKFPVLSETAVLNQVTGLLQRNHQVDLYALEGIYNESEAHGDVAKYQLLNRTFSLNVSSNRSLSLLKGINFIFKNLLTKPVKLELSKGFNRKTAVTLLRLSQAKVLLCNGPYDIIHCHYGTIGRWMLFLKESHISNSKLVVAFHGFDLSLYLKKYGEQVYQELFLKGDLFLPVSERWKNRLIELGCSPQKIVVHRAGINVDCFSFNARRPKTDGKVQLLTVGRLVEKKGLEYAVQAVARVLKRYPNLDYMIVGDGPLRDSLASSIKELGLERHIQLVGWKKQEEVAVLLQEADLFLSPSVTSQDGDQEGIPATLMEAMARGLPVLSTYHSGIPELVEDGKSGFLVPERDVEALTTKLTYLLDHPECWPEMGYAGRKYVEAHYDLNKLNDRLVHLYQQLL
ncbi:MAG: glycosyltransferase [Anaerolineales bacterium]|nr:glycosyltransferase [Anaerolineales bacterium]